MSLQAPTVMVSSTFYDLHEVRHQLARMLESDLGYHALISESPSFPIDPDVDTLENCRRRVEENADILVLVIGRRYGTVDAHSGKSVTNIEYSAARAKNIPIYVFIERHVQVLFDAWTSAEPENKAAIGATVDDSRLFEFIHRVRTLDRVWTNGFDYASDIIGALRIQLSYLMKLGVEVLMAARSHPDRGLLSTLSAEAFRLAVDQPRFWEYLLFGQVLDDEVQAAADRRREFDMGLIYGSIIVVTDAEIFQWIRNRVGEIRDLSRNVATVVSESAVAFGPPGEPGSVRAIVFVARQLAKIYVSLIEWSQLVRRTRASSTDMQGVVDRLSALGSEMIDSIGAFGAEVRLRLSTAIEELDSNPLGPDEQPRELDLTLQIEIPKLEDVLSTLELVMRQRGADI